METLARRRPIELIWNSPRTTRSRPSPAAARLEFNLFSPAKLNFALIFTCSAASAQQDDTQLLLLGHFLSIGFFEFSPRASTLIYVYTYDIRIVFDQVLCEEFSMLLRSGKDPLWNLLSALGLAHDNGDLGFLHGAKPIGVLQGRLLCNNVYCSFSIRDRKSSIKDLRVLVYWNLGSKCGFIFMLLLEHAIVYLLFL